MDMIGNEDYKLITLQDFPFICRICCLKRGDLRLFLEENHLDVFHSIMKINVRSTAEYPKNVCDVCISELEDISLFIKISQYNKANFGKNFQPKTEIIECADGIESVMSQNLKKIEGNWEDMLAKGTQLCRICFSSASSPMPCEEKTHLIELFENITNINAETEFNISKMDSICNKCTNELKKISSFVTSSFSNDQKIEEAIGRNTNVKTENYPNPIDIEFSTCQELKLESVIDRNDMSENTFEEIPYFHESKVKLEVIDIKEEIIDGSLVTSMDNGVNVITRSVKKPFVCDCCQNSFTTERKLRRHLLTHTGEKPFKCDICNKCFNKKCRLKQHMHSHTGESPFECNICEKKFSNKHSLHEHMLLHNREKPFKCDSCEKCFAWKSKLQNHMLIHSRENLFKCDSCEKTFKLKQYLNEHNMLLHSEEKPFKCDICNKCFIKKCRLKEHMHSHTGERPFKCDNCKKRFTQKSKLQRHMRSHTGEKPFKCDFCKQCFNRKDNWRKHMLIHNREKPFKCDCCKKTFKLKQYLNKHIMLLHSREKPFKCDL